MGFRITTNMMMSTYRYNLMNSTNKLADSSDKVMTGRNFNSYAEDPASASQAFRLRRQWCQSSSQLANTDSTYNKFHTAWTNLGGVIRDLSDANGRVSAIRGTNDPTAEGRRALALVLRETADSVVESMNQKVGEQFIFAGNDQLNVPFSWNDDHTVLYYRGVNVNAGGVKMPTAAEPTWLDDWANSLKGALDAGNITQDGYDQGMAWIKYYRHETDTAPENVDPKITLNNLAGPNPSAKDLEWIEYYAHETPDKPVADEPAWGAKDPQYGVPENMPDPPQTDDEKAWVAYYKDQADVKKLEIMSKEQLNLDLGMGMKEDENGKLINGSAFDSALRGISFLNYGVDENGDSNCLPMVMRELADVFETWGENGQRYLPEKYRDKSYDEIQAILNDKDSPEAKELTEYHTEMQAKANRLMDKLNAAQAHTTEKYVELDAKASFLKSNSSRLSTEVTNLNEQVLDVEQINLADAITQLSWDKMCYNAALKIGTDLLSQSLIDYMH